MATPTSQSCTGRTPTSSSRTPNPTGNPSEHRKSALPEEARSFPKKNDRVTRIPTVLKITPRFSGTDHEPASSLHSGSSSRVSSSASGTSESSIHFDDDSSHDDTVGVVLPPPSGPRSRIDPRKVTASPYQTPTLPPGAEAYDTIRATWPGSVAYACSFLAARMAQFALTAVGNTQGAALAFASLAGVLHIGVEPVIGALRDRMGMRSDEDTANYTNYVTSLTDYVECSLRGDSKGQEQARKVARGILASYNFDCAYDDSLPDHLQKPMPGFFDEAATMLKAGARGIASNELPFFSFAVVYMLTNPAGLWSRETLLGATGSEQLAKASELLFSVAGGILSGAATVGLQNAGRQWIQSTQHAPARKNIQLDRLNWRGLAFTQQSLDVLRNATLDALDSLDDAGRDDADREGIERDVAEHLYRAHVQPADTEQVTQDISLLLQQVSRQERQDLLTEIEQVQRQSRQPYALSSAVADKYRQMVATKDKQGVYQTDSGKIRRLLARTAGNVAGLMVYSMSLMQAIDTVARYAPASLPAPGNATGTDPHSTPPEQAYGQMASLGWTLIGCWVAGRALVPPVADLMMAPLTSGVKGLLHAGQSLWQSCQGGPDTATPQNSPDIV